MQRMLRLLVPVQTGDPTTAHPKTYAAGDQVAESELSPGLVAHWESWGGIFEVVEDEPRDAAGRFTTKGKQEG